MSRYIYIVYLNLILVLRYYYIQALNDYEVERNVLINFYKATNGDDWINNENWLSDEPLSTWYGVTINEEGYVQILSLGSNNLKGCLNDDFGYLYHLKDLDFGFNYLSCTLPSSFSTLSSLRYLSLDTNYFEGFIVKFKFLKQLLVNGNLLTGPLKANSSNLVDIYCSNNYFTGLINQNLFTNDIEYFNIHTNYFTGLAPYIANSSRLTTFNIEYNIIWGLLPELPLIIKYFDVTSNLFSGEMDFPWEQLSQLIAFSTFQNQLTGTLSVNTSSSSLQIDCSYNLFTGSAPKLLMTFDGFAANVNYLTGSIDDLFDYSCALQYLGIFSNYLINSIPSSLANCVYLQSVLLSYNYLTGSISDSFTSLEKIQRFSFSNNILSGKLSNEMVNSMRLLQFFEISNNKLEGTIPSGLKNCKLLRSLLLSYNQFTGNFPMIANQILEEAHLNDNFFSGTLPTFKPALEDFLVGNNYFTGFINYNPRCSRLLSYEVNNNYLIGTIPSFTGSTLLNALFLNSNYLTGSLPVELCYLTSIRLFNINDLDMCVPSCLIRASYSVSKYDFIRCQNEQDIAICSFIKQTDVYDKLTTSVDYVTQVYESSHPINEYDSTTYFNLVNISRAVKYQISFDSWTSISVGDTIQICEDYFCLKVIASYNYLEILTINGNNALEIPYAYFYITIFNKNFNDYYQNWGYLVTVKAFFSVIGWICTSPSVIVQSYDNDTLSKYNLIVSNSYAANICNNDNNWLGVDCTFGLVTSLSLESYGIAGILPSTLSLLTALQQLHLSYNSLCDVIPETIGDLTNLQLLDLSNNKLKYAIPTQLGQLTQLQYLYLQSNYLTGTVPESLAYLNDSLLVMSLSANQLTGKLTSELCSLANATIDVSGNNLICYEECWDKVYDVSLKSGDISICAPTSYPTSQPSSPTFQPTQINVSSFNYHFNQYWYILVVVLVLMTTFLIFRYVNSEKRKLRKHRNEILDKLPIHRYILQQMSQNDILRIIMHSASTLAIEDFDGNNVIDLALEHKLSNEIITVILKQLLSMQSHESVLSHDFKYAWIRVIQSDIYLESVRHILDVFYTLSGELSYCLDENGRSAVNIASPLCRQAIKESTYFLRRYDFGKNIYPTHVSETSVIYLAIDTTINDDNSNKVALKFISRQDSYINEICSRIDLSTESDFIIPIIESYDASKNSLYNFEIHRRKLDKYLYCIVMPAGEKNLGNIIGTERIAGKDWAQLKVITTQLALSINQLHNKQYIHGDIKPLNVVRLGNDIKLIDFDACVKVGSNYYGSKYSLAYVPPEFLNKDEYGNICINASSSTNSSTLKADYSQDSWSLGMLLYELYTGMGFFLKDSDDYIDSESIEILYDFKEEVKLKKLSKITDRFARNLISLLLQKDPCKRLSMCRVLEHPFISGKSAIRLQEEDAEYDMFLSYRMESDAHHAEKIYELFTSQGLKVWFDRKSLLPGKNWEEGFSDGLVKSRILVPIISRNSLNHPTNHRSNVTLLHEDSPCDNVLLEYELALELKERGLITQIYPILFGDYDENSKEYSDYFSSGCYPQDTKSCIVKSIDRNVKNHLNRLGLGSRLLDNEGVQAVIEAIFKSQGVLIKGSNDKIFESLRNDASTMKYINTT